MVLLSNFAVFAENAVRGRKTAVFCEKFSALFSASGAVAKRMAEGIICIFENIFCFCLLIMKNYCIFVTLYQKVIL